MKQFTHTADSHKLAALARRYPDVAKQPHSKPARGMFSLYFNNKKRQIRGYESHECEGTLYSDHSVHLNTHHFPQREFTSLREMTDAIGEYGDCAISWIDEVKE